MIRLLAQRDEMAEEFNRLFQAVEGYRCGALTRDGLMHYYEIARQFRIAHPEIIPQTAGGLMTIDELVELARFYEDATISATYWMEKECPFDMTITEQAEQAARTARVAMRYALRLIDVLESHNARDAESAQLFNQRLEAAKWFDTSDETAQ